MKVEELAKDPNKFKIEIKKNHLQIDKDLILLFGADGGFHFITNEEKYVIKIIVGCRNFFEIFIVSASSKKNV